MSNALNLEVSNLASSALIDLFVLSLDATETRQAFELFFHTGTSSVRGSVWFNSQEYIPLPVEISGLEISAQGMMPTPVLRVGNVTGVVSDLLAWGDDFIGAKLTRRRTFMRFLDARNFLDGINPDANPLLSFPDTVFFVEQKTAETALLVEFRLVSAVDVSHLKLPRRQVVANLCSWVYRGESCGFMAGYTSAEQTQIDPQWMWSSQKTYNPVDPLLSVSPLNWIAFSQTSATDSTVIPWRALTVILGNANSPNPPPHLDLTRWKRDYCSHTLADCKKHFGPYSALPFGGFVGTHLISST